MDVSGQNEKLCTKSVYEMTIYDKGEFWHAYAQSFSEKEKLQNKAFHAERAGKNYLYNHDVNGIVL